MKLLESGEMYLETILILSKEKPFIRSIDIAEYMNFSKPSVSRGVSKLKEQGYIEIEKNGHITLTNSGIDIANKIYSRHTTLTKLLTSLGVNQEIASADACKIEHDISDETFSAIQEYINTIS